MHSLASIHSFIILVLTLALAPAGLTSLNGVLAQTTTAICESEYAWTKNSRGQYPCLVAAYLQDVCTTGNFNIDALVPGNHYLGPEVGKSDPCRCSMVTYNLVSACGSCQGGIWIQWSEWLTNCTKEDVSVASFPKDVPSTTAIPPWAFLDISSGDTWDLATAHDVALQGQPGASEAPPGSTTTGSPDTTAGTPPPASNSQSSLINSSNPSATPQSPSAPLSSASASGITGGVGDNASAVSGPAIGGTGISGGAIIGCVIGGVAVIAFFGLAWYLRRSRRPRLSLTDPPADTLPYSTHWRESQHWPSVTESPLQPAPRAIGGKRRLQRWPPSASSPSLSSSALFSHGISVPGPPPSYRE